MGVEGITGAPDVSTTLSRVFDYELCFTLLLVLDPQPAPVPQFHSEETS